MTRLDEILDFNHRFVEEKCYAPMQTSKFPDKKMVVLSCMDTRLTELLPRAMNFKNGDAKFIKNAGAVVSHPFGSVMRSILVGIYELGAKEVLVVGHYQCGMSSIDPQRVLNEMTRRGVPESTIHTLHAAGINLIEWFSRIESIEEGVRETVRVIQEHPLMPPLTPVHGLIIDPQTGHLDLVVNGYQ